MSQSETVPHNELFVMDGLAASALTDEYVTETLPGAGIDAIQKTVAGTGDGFDEALESIKDLQERIDSWEGVSQARSVTDLKREEELQILFGFQDSTPLEDDPRNARIFKQLGVRIIQLTYNSRNLSGNGCTERVDGGISNYGLEVIDAIERNNLLLDLSHAGHQTAADALEAASQPTVFSHANPQAVHDHPRNIPDYLIEAAIETGGTVGLNAYPDFVADNPTLDDLIDHAEYLDDLVGIENVTLGLDFIDNRPYEDLEILLDDPAYPDEPTPYPERLESAAQVPNITDALIERGFDDDEVRGIMGENLLDVYERVWD